MKKMSCASKSSSGWKAEGKGPFSLCFSLPPPQCVSEQFLVMLVRWVAWLGERITGLRNRTPGFRPVSLTS